MIGNGVVLDPIAFLKEVGRLRDLGVDVDRQRVCLEPRAGDPALSPHDRAGGGERAGAQEDRHDEPRHRAGV